MTHDADRVETPRRPAPEELRRLSVLLDTALDLAPAERAAWVAALPPEDAALAPSLAALLRRAAAAETADLLDRGPSFSPPAEVADEGTGFEAGDTVGPYRLVGRLGEGGMGEVWLAERHDGQLKRAVALKLPTLGLRRGVLVQRFERERDILASLSHPNIARLYDAGQAEDGQLYLALERVDGVPVTTYVRQHRLGQRAIVRLLLQVMDAVQHAHAHLVIHRDLKPGNVLVTADGRAMLLDFGIAKLLAVDETAAEATELTRLGGRALSLAYAAPEQIAGGAISTATDVWALGVLAYELLAGVRPFGGDRRSLEAAIVERDPERPAGVAADLSTVVMKALKKAPADRHVTVGAFADDLQRWLDGMPVRAQPDRWTYRARRFVGRHRLGVAVAAGTALSVFAAGGVALWQAQVAREQARIARTEAQTAAAVQDFLEGLFKASSGDQVDPSKARQRTAVDLLDAGAARVEQALANEPRAQLRVLDTLSQVYEDIGLLDRAAGLRGRAAAVAERSEGPGSPAQVRALAAQAQALNAGGDNAQAQAVLERADRLLAAQGAPDTASRIAVDIAIADLYNYRDDPRGLPHAERAMSLLRRGPPSPEWVDTLSLLGGLRRTTRDFDGARRALSEAAEVAAALPGGVASKLPALYDLWAWVELDSGQGDRGIELLRKVVAMDEAAGGPDSPNVFSGRSRLVTALVEEGRAAEALPVVRAMRERADRVADLERHRYSSAMLEAAALLSLGRTDAAWLVLRAMPDAASEAARYPVTAFSALLVLARVHIERGDGAAAKEALDRAQRLAAERDLGGAGATSRLEIERARLALRQGRVADAVAAEAAASAEMDASIQPMRRVLLKSDVALASGDALRAETLVREALTTLDAGGPAARGRRIIRPALQVLLGRALVRQGRHADAAVVLAEALTTQRSVFDRDVSLTLADTQLALSEALHGAGDIAGAKAQFEAASAIHGRQAPLGPDRRAAARRVAELLKGA